MSDDPLCRALTTSEQQWLAQSSLILISAKLTPEVAASATDATIAAALAACRKRQPFLNVKIDADALRFARCEAPTPFTVQTVVKGGSVGSTDTLRAIMREQLNVGVDRSVSLARAHLVIVGEADKDDHEAHLLVICDHLCFDGKSLVTWLMSCLAALVSKKDEKEQEMLPFVNWSTAIPANVSLPPFAPPFDSAVVMPLKAELAEKIDMLTSGVLDVVAEVAPADFQTLKAAAKLRGSKLNAPLMTAYFAAVADTIAWQRAGAGEAPLDPINIRSCCAVDLRAALSPPLAADYMNNSASVVPAWASFSAALLSGDGGDLWPAAAEAQAGMLAGIAAGEGFRLNDITKRGAFAEMGPYFAIACLWSNIGHVEGSGAIDAAEFHMAGAGTNPILSAHVVEVGGRLAFTATYAPHFVDREVAERIAERFVHHVRKLATAPAPAK